MMLNKSDTRVTTANIATDFRDRIDITNFHDDGDDTPDVVMIN